MNPAPDIKVSIAEVCEVRGCGLESSELLSLAASATDGLPPCPKGTVFDPENVFVSNKGTVVIQTTSSSSVDPSFVPPEWARGEYDDGAAAVYCLGAVMRACGAEEAADVDLFSLVNILTVGMVGTRPTANRMGQMARNQLRGRDPRAILISLYEEIMGDEESNQLPDDMDYDDLSMDGSMNGGVVPVGVGAAPVVPMITTMTSNGSTIGGGGGVMKRAVEFFDEDEENEKESRGASTSSSSGNSTQKDHSPFDDEIEEEIIEHRVPSPIAPARSAKFSTVTTTSTSESTTTTVLQKMDTSSVSLHDHHNLSDDSDRQDSLLGIGSPIGNSTRLNETFVEEHSVNLSFNRSFEDNFVDSSPVKSVNNNNHPEGKRIHPSPPSNPFEDNDFAVSDGGTLSGRDPFEDERLRSQQHPASSAVEEKRRQPFDEFKDFTNKQKQSLAHRFSSSDEDIVQADIDDERFGVAGGSTKTYFDDIVKDRRTSSDSTPKQPDLPEPAKINEPAASISSGYAPSYKKASTARRGSSATAIELDRLKSETDRLRADAGRLLAEEMEDLPGRGQREEEDDDEEEAMDARSHVEAVVITEQPSIARGRQGSDADNEEEEDDDVPETAIEDAFQEARRERTASNAGLVVPFLADPVVVSPIEESADSPRLERRNSLAPSRVSGRQSTRSMRGKRKTRAIPEFFDNSRHPSIRLKAPSAKKKKMTLMRVEHSEVWVELLNGQRVEVSCRTDAIARDIFSLVVQHMNINEHVFFGLSFVRDGEHFFLEDHQRLEKFAPTGWKAGSRGTQRHQFVLYLRFRFYPQMLDFIKTEVTMHELYLQVRRDVIEERIQPKRDAAFELAALALQAEFGNRPPAVILDYFDNPHYLPKRYCSNDDPNRLHSILADQHSHQHGLKTTDAEHRFIQICQRHGDFSAHLHRVFRNKPSHSIGASPFDPDTGASLWIAIMPRGIAIYEEQGGVRERLSEYQWPDTQTLQFDKKKFVIVAVREGRQTETVLYTDHHSKSSYFVKFAASQHRFMMKMRQWKTTLKHENTMQAMPDVAVEGREPHHPVREDGASPVSLDDAHSMFARMPDTPTATATRPPPQVKQSSVSTPAGLPPFSSSTAAAAGAASSGAKKSTSVRPTIAPPATSARNAQVLDVSVASQDRSMQLNKDETASNSLLERFESASHPAEDGEEAEGMRFEVTLVKDPAAGLGLTLVDGNLNGVKGVYVKSVAENGAGMRAGLCVGDRLLAVDGKTMENGDRHKAVELVKESGASVRMEIARLDGVVRHEKSLSRENDVMNKKASTQSFAGVGLYAPVSTKAGQSRTPPAPRKAANRRQRAVSDFGAIGDTLPTLDSDNVIDIKAISGLHLDESDDERGEFRLPTASMYSFDHHHHDDEEDDPPSVHSNGGKSAADASPASRDYIPAPSDGKRKYRYARKSNLDWTEELDEVEEDEQSDIVYVSLDRNQLGSLGVQIASVGGKVCVKQLTAAPAQGHPDIRVGMQLVYVNNEEVTGRSHQEVVSLLRSGGQTVVLGLRREEKEEGGESERKTEGAEKERDGTITVTLQKQPHGTLGLSLAKRTGSEGIFIRMIADGSAAAQEGSLRVGDRLLSMDDHSVDGLSPSAILDRLRVANGPVRLTVTRQ